VAACAAGVLPFVGLVPLAVGEIGVRTDAHSAKNTAKITTTTTTTTSAAKHTEDASSAPVSGSLTAAVADAGSRGLHRAARQR
jgi:hypothetical protein